MGGILATGGARQRAAAAPSGRNVVEEPAARRLAGAAAASSGEHRSPSLAGEAGIAARQRASTHRGVSRPSKGGHPERGGREKVLGRASPGRRGEGRKRPARNRAHRATAEPACQRGKQKRRTLYGCGAVRQCASPAPRHCPGRRGAPALRKGYDETPGSSSGEGLPPLNSPFRSQRPRTRCARR